MTWFDIVPMISCHILLGRPCFDANEVWYNNALHVYFFTWGHKKYNLHVCTPSTFVEMTSKSLCAPLRGWFLLKVWFNLILLLLLLLFAPLLLLMLEFTLIVIELDKSIAINIVPDDIDVPKCESNIAIGSELITMMLMILSLIRLLMTLLFVLIMTWYTFN